MTAAILTDPSGRLHEKAVALEVLPKLAALPLGRLYGNYLFLRLLWSLRAPVRRLETCLKAGAHDQIPTSMRQEWAEMLAQNVGDYQKILAAAREWTDQGLLYRFLARRFVRVMGKLVALTQAAADAIPAGAEESFTYEELDDAEEQAFSNRFLPKSEAKL